MYVYIYIFTYSRMKNFLSDDNMSQGHRSCVLM